MTGTVTLTRLLVRTNRVRLTLWAIAIPGLLALGAASIKSLYSTPADRQAYAAMADLVPAQIAFNGPAVALTTLGGIVIFEAGWLLMLAVCVANILFVVRTTRAQEEQGTLEFLLAGRVSAGAPLAATALVVTGFTAVVAAASAAVLISTGTSATGAVTYATAIFAAGLFFAAVAACAAQVTEHSRAAAGLAFAVLGTSFLLRAVGDIRDDAFASLLPWLSPLGWAQATEPFGANRFLPALLLLGTTAVVAWVAWRLNTTRDLGAGVIAPRPGRVRASWWAASPTGIQLHLARGTMLGWVAGVAVLAGAFGAMATTAEDFAASSEATTEVIAAFGGASLVDGFLVFSILVVAVVTAGCVVSITLRLRSDEDSGRLALLATAPLPRYKVVASYLLAALSAGLLLLTAGGLAMGIGYASGTGNWNALGGITASTIAQFPAVAALGGIAIALTAMRPQAAPFAWLAYAVTAIITVLGPVFSLPGWAIALSAFDHAATYPAAYWSVALITLGGALAAFAGGIFTRRDLAS